MKITDYQKKVKTFAIYKEPDYPLYLLVSEIGEYFGKIAKEKRGDYTTEQKEELRKAKLLELGDIAWAVAEIGNINEIKINLIEKTVINDFFDFVYIANEILNEINKYSQKLNLEIMFFLISQQAKSLGSNLTEVMQMNIEKLTDRKNRNVIKGEGDYR
jgi:NTP pyrophosphatase (non-canonical NTP hydrolase)